MIAFSKPANHLSVMAAVMHMTLLSVHHQRTHALREGAYWCTCVHGGAAVHGTHLAPIAQSRAKWVESRANEMAYGV